MKAKIILIAALLTFTACPPAGAIDMPDKGVHKEYFPNGRVKMLLRFKDEKLVRRRMFYENGRLMSDYIYRDGQLIKTRMFHDNGNRKSDWSAKTGIARIYNSEGKLIREGVYQ